MFSIGDILYTKVQDSDNSYHHDFAVVTNITSNGQISIDYIGKFFNNEFNLNNKHSMTDIVVPNISIKLGHSCLIDKDGSYRTYSWHNKFHKYTNNTLLADYSDYRK